VALDCDEAGIDASKPRLGGLFADDDLGAEERQLREWIALIVVRDQAAFAALYAAMAGRLYHLALRITGDSGSAEEAAEDAFWQVWRQAPRFDPARGRALAWLVTIVRSRALDIRRQQARDEDELDDALLDGLVGPQGAGAPFSRLASEQTGRQLQAALAQLEPLPRQLLALAYYRGLTHEEIAAHTALPLGTVKAHLRRALLRLRNALNPADHRSALDE